LKTSDFDYHLPAELIAQAPLPRRDQSRLLVLERSARGIQHQSFPDLATCLRAGDTLVLNNSLVIPARLYGRKETTGARIEILLLEEIRTNDWWVLLRPGKRAPTGSDLTLIDRQSELTDIKLKVVDKNDEGHYRVIFENTPEVQHELARLGHVPLPPYITRPDLTDGIDDRERYQTIYARWPGSVAAPTAGLHFTPELLRQITRRGVRICQVTLHVGVGTFAPVKSERLSAHRMHAERFDLPADTVAAIQQTRSEQGRVIAVGTTTVRVLEGVAAQHDGHLRPGSGQTSIFIHPPYAFKVVDGLVTNFHLPKSTLLMLVSAFAAPGKCQGRDLVMQAYAEAIQANYRFYSYGDAMLLL
jgi:S-adenosylmethionine:tRNA ribosyltransferase-isomerase